MCVGPARRFLYLFVVIKLWPCAHETVLCASRTEKIQFALVGRSACLSIRRAAAARAAPAVRPQQTDTWTSKDRAPEEQRSMPNTTRVSHATGATRKTTSSRPKASTSRHSRRTNPREVSVILASEADVLAALEALPPPDALPPPTMEVAALSMGLSSLVEQLRPMGRTTLVDLPEELLLTIVERAFLTSIADAHPVERLAALAVTCRALRFLGSDRCAEHLARALYPASSLKVAARAAMPMWTGLSSVVEQLRRTRDPRDSVAAPQRPLRPQAYLSWRSCEPHPHRPPMCIDSTLPPG